MGLFSYRTEKGEETCLAEKCRGNYEWDFLHSQSVCMCLFCPSLPSLSCQNTLACISPTGTEVLCTSISETGVPVFQLATAVLQNALKIAMLLRRYCTSQEIHFLNSLLHLSVTPHSMCLQLQETELELLNLFNICSRGHWIYLMV